MKKFLRTSLIHFAVLTFAFTGLWLLHAQSYLPTVPAPVPITGLGVPVQVAQVSQLNQTSSIGQTTLFTVGATTAQFFVKATDYCDAATAGGSITLVFHYTDPSNTFQTVTSGASCGTLGSASFTSVTFVLAAKNATTISYQTSTNASAPYDVRIQVYQSSLN